MSLRRFYSRRRAASASALLGILLYVALIPVHTVSQTTTALLEAELGGAYRVLCHGGTGELSNIGHSKPTIPGTHCPFCQALASVHVAFSAPEKVVIAPNLALIAVILHEDRKAASLIAPVPQNRGPPPVSI